MTDAEIAELVKGLRFMAQTWNDNRNLNKAADALEQQAKEVAAFRIAIDTRDKIAHAREGALRNSGDQVRGLNDEVLRISRDLAAAEERIEFRVRQTDEVLAANRQLRRENAELRERVVEIKHSDLCRLSRIFNAASDLSGTQDYSINEWLKKQIALAKPASPSPQEPQRTSITETTNEP